LALDLADTEDLRAKAGQRLRVGFETHTARAMRRESSMMDAA
jgi:hypothetical protein